MKVDTRALTTPPVWITQELTLTFETQEEYDTFYKILSLTATIPETLYGAGQDEKIEACRALMRTIRYTRKN